MEISIRARVLRFTILIILGLLSTSSTANLLLFEQQDLGDFLSKFGKSNVFAAYVDGLEKLRDQKSLRNAHKWSELSLAWQQEYRSCVDTYNALYADDVLEMNLVFGYSDVQGKVLDRSMYQMMLETLLRPCAHARQSFCGFRQVSAPIVSRNVTTLEKTIPFYRGGRRVELTFRLTMAYSSHSESDHRNFKGDVMTADQDRFTRAAEEVFFGGIQGRDYEGRSIRSCEVCVYHGHARDGGGPDMGPVLNSWRKASGTPNYDKYQKHRRNHRKLLTALLNSRLQPPKFVGLMACYSDRHFYGTRIPLVEGDSRGMRFSLKDFNDHTAFLVTDKYSYFKNWERNVGLLLDTLLNFKCRSAYEENLSQLTGIPKAPEYFQLRGQFL